MKSHSYRISRGVRGASWRKDPAKPQLQRPVESVTIPEFEMDFCFLLQDAIGTSLVTTRGPQPTLCDGGCGSPKNTMSAALAAKSDECGYFSAYGVRDSSPEGGPRTSIEVFGGEDRAEGKRRWNSAQG